MGLTMEERLRGLDYHKLMKQQRKKSAVSKEKPPEQEPVVEQLLTPQRKRKPRSQQQSPSVIPIEADKLPQTLPQYGKSLLSGQDTLRYLAAVQSNSHKLCKEFDQQEACPKCGEQSNDFVMRAIKIITQLEEMVIASSIKIKNLEKFVQAVIAPQSESSKLGTTMCSTQESND